MGAVLKFEIKFVSVVAVCDNCCATYIAHIRETEYKLLEGKSKICPYCKTANVYYCRRS